jgi:hypothetical protein
MCRSHAHLNNELLIQSVLLETKELVDEADVFEPAEEEAGVRRLIGAGRCYRCGRALSHC